MNRFIIILILTSTFTSCVVDIAVETTYTYFNNSSKMVSISWSNRDVLDSNLIIPSNDSFSTKFYDLGGISPPFDSTDSLIIIIEDSISHHFNQFNLTDEMNLLYGENYEGGRVEGSNNYHFTYTFID